jgi:hypothetical protein
MAAQQHSDKSAPGSVAAPEPAPLAVDAATLARMFGMAVRLGGPKARDEKGVRRA